MKRYGIDSYDWREEEDINGDWVKYTDHETEISKLTNLNKKLTRWHRKAIRHSVNLGDQLEKIYADLRRVNESLIAKDYIAAVELLSEILEGE